MPPIIHLESEIFRRIVLLLFMPFYILIVFGIRLGRSVEIGFADISEVFKAVWKGHPEQAPLLPCPFCGGKANPDGWRAPGGATGPACEQCGATTWSAYTWNNRIAVPEELIKKIHQEQQDQ